MIQTVRGTKDILPTEVKRWRWCEAIIAEWMRRYGYAEIRTPILEYAELFYRGVGEATDAVGKEMYVFSDRSGELLALRPELTAPVARAIVQHSLAAQSSLLRLWYYGPCFRYERPQKGRQRQFHQVGAECIGIRSPDADVEIIALAWDILTSIVPEGTVQLYINTLGSRQTQERYRALLVEYLQHHRDHLSPISQQRLTINPLRILDSKDERDQQVIAQAPQISAALSDEDQAHYARVLDLLDEVGIPYTEDPYLVRGLDYYTHTVFEFRSSRLGAQDAVGGGGRYDNLISDLGGKPLPGVGFGVGMERLLLAMDEEPQGEEWLPQVYIAAQPSMSYHQLGRWLRQAGIACVIDLEFRSLKAQLRQAHRMRSAVVIMQGHGETLVVKDMRTGHQLEVPFMRDDVLAAVQQLVER